MAVTSTLIQTEFPEFSETDTTLIDAKIADAVKRVNASVWGDLTDDGVKYLACHLIAMSPEGEQSRLELKSGPDAGKATTTYWLEYERLRIASGAGLACKAI